MTAKLLYKAAYVPLLMAALLFTVTSGCKKKGNTSSGNDGTAVLTYETGQLTAVVGTTTFKCQQLTSVDDTVHHRFQVSGMVISGGDTSVLAVYFPDSVLQAAVVKLDGQSTSIQYFNKDGGYSQDAGDGAGSITILGLDASHQQVSGAFSATVYKNGFETDSPITVAAGSFSTAYVIH
jgi:hypothetical protein